MYESNKTNEKTLAGYS